MMRSKAPPKPTRPRGKGVPPSFAGGGGSTTLSCPSCGGGPISVVDSRPRADANYTRRVRVCHACGVRYTTYEITDTEMTELAELRKFKDIVTGLLRKIETT